MVQEDRDRLALDVFALVCEADPSERTHVIDQHCGEDSDLRRRVERLLAADSNGADENAAGFLDRVVQDFGLGQQASANDSSSDQFDANYKILRVIGEGGMGTVYEAEQTNPRRRVAIKAVRADVRSPAARRRFEYEAQTLAKLEHPGIARLYHADVRPAEGAIRAFLAMEFVDGLPLDEFARSRKLDIPDRVALLIRVCDAVTYAHRKGVIHRDLKPANILVAPDGQPKVLDFGIAKATDQTRSPAASLVSLTVTGQIVGSLAYMSPEQLDGRPDVDTRADVYALGVTLYLLLTGKHPIDISDTGIVSAVQKLLNGVPAPLGRIDRRLRGDLEVIAARALEKEPTRRYASVEQFAADLQRFLDGRAIEARADSMSYVLRKALWRNRRVVAAAAVLVAGLTAFAIYASVQAAKNRSLAITADAAKIEAQRAQGIAEQARVAAESARRSAEERAEALRRSAYISNIGFATLSLARDDAAGARRTLDQCDPDLRGWEWGHLRRQTDRSLTTVPISIPRPVFPDATSDATRIAVTAGITDCSVIDVATGHAITTINCRGFARNAISPKGNRLIVTVNADVRCYTVPGGEEVWKTRVQLPRDTGIIPSVINGVRFTADGRLVIVSSGHGSVRILDVETGQVVSGFAARSCNQLEILPDSGELVILTQQGPVERRSRTGEILCTYEGQRQLTGAGALGISSDGALIAAADTNGRVIVWNTQTGREQSRLESDRGAVRGLCFAPDGLLIAAFADAAIRSIDISGAAARVRDTYLGHSAAVVMARVLPGAPGRMVSVSDDGTMKTWSYPQEPIHSEIASGRRNSDLTILGNSSTLCVAAGTKTLQFWNTQLLREESSPVESLPFDAAFVTSDSTGRVLAISGASGELCFFDRETKRTVGANAKPEGLLRAAIRGQFTVGGGGFVTVSQSGRPRLFNTSTGVIESLNVPAGRLYIGGSLDPASSRLVAAKDEKTLTTSTWPGLIPIAQSAPGESRITNIQYSNDGRRIAAGGMGTVVLYDANSLKPIREMAGNPGRIKWLSFNPSDTRLVAAGQDGVIRIWDTTSGALMASLTGHRSAVLRVEFTPDGGRLFSLDFDGVIRVWTGTTPGERRALLAPAATLPTPSFSATQPSRAMIGEIRIRRD